MRILLTNDDSHDSPLFLYTIAALRQFGDVEIVVPAEEQSWKGKAMTRIGAIYADRIDLHGTPAWSVTGTPADCVNLAIHNLLDEPPDLIVSGTNIGKNVGLGFIFASGTVGACLEGNIAGIPGIAFSQELLPEQFHHWMDERAFPAAVAAQLEDGIARLLPAVWDALDIDRHRESFTWNVNFPAAEAATCEIRRTRIGLTFYDQCFEQRGDQFHHHLSNARIDESEDTDDRVIRSGHVSVTAIDLKDLGQNLEPV